MENENQANQDPTVQREIEMVENLRKVFEGFQDGFKLAIKRAEPKWCEGTLETIELSSDNINEINPDDIIKKWGGEVLRLNLLDKGGQYITSATLKARTFEPRKYYKRLAPPWEQDDKDKKPEQSTFPTTPFEQHPALDLNAVIGAVRQIIADERKHYQQIQPPPPPAVPAPTPAPLGIGDYVRLARQMRDLNSAMGFDVPKESTGGEGLGDSETMALIRTIGEVAAALKPQAAAPPQYPRVIQGQPTTARQQRPPNFESAQNNGQNTFAGTGNLPALIAQMEPDAFAKLALTSLEKMQQSKAEKAIRAIVTGLGLAEEIEDSDPEEIEDTDTETESDMD